MTAHEYEAVPVLVVNPDNKGANTNPQAADYGAYTTFTLAATTPAQQIIGEDPRRSRAYVFCSGTGPVYIGSQAQCQASPVLGYQLVTGTGLEIKNNQQVWLAPDGSHSATVSVLIERWGDSAAVGEQHA